jgi:kynureninase
MTNFHQTRDLFHLPDGMIYLDGNSLGPLPKATSDRVAQAVTDEWGAHLISAWNSCGWMQMPRALGDRIGRLIGAEPGHTVVGDTLSIKVFQALAAALRLNPERRVILSDNGNFPSDLYIAQGLIRLLDRDYELRVVAPEDIEANITDDIAVTLITEVDYRTGRRHDMKALTAKAHAHGALAIWDLAHSAGAFPVYLSDCNADFAVGCTYKYLNAGPGAPAFIYTAPKHAAQAEPALAGWMGHDAPFAFEQDYRPGQGIERMRVGTPPVIQMAALDAALQIWDQVDMEALRTRSLELTDRFIAAVETTCPDLELATPRDHAMRGSQVSFRHAEGYAVMQALIAQGVVGDFRAPDILRFGFTPLYTTDQDVDRAAEILAEILDQRLWDTPEFKARKAVT